MTGYAVAGPAPELVEAAGQQAGHVHLADAEALGDLRLGHALVEAEVEHDLLPLGEAGDERAQGGPALGPVEVGVEAAELAEQAGAVVVVAAAGVERGRPVGRAGFDGLEHLVLGDCRPGRRSRDRWASRPSSCDRSSTTRVTRRCSSWTRRGTRTAQPLSRKWRLSSPTMVGVAKVVNSRPRSGSKRSTALARPRDGDLDEVVEGLAPVGEAAGQVLGQAEVGLDELVAERRVPRLGEPREGAQQRRLVGAVEGHRLAARLALHEPEAERRPRPG